MKSNQPKYSFYGLLETPTDLENDEKQSKSCSDSLSSKISRHLDERNGQKSTLFTPKAPIGSRMRPPRTPMSTSGSRMGPPRTPLIASGSRMRPPRTPLSTSSSAMRTPRGPEAATTTPYTASSAVSYESESSTIVALVEGRGYARGEIGIASFDLRQPVLTLSQFSDGQTYAKTLSKLQILNPLEILLPNTMCETNPSNKLFYHVSQQFPQVTISSVQRRYYNENKGLQFVKHLCADEYKAIELQVSSKYYCLATAGALIKYVEFVQNIVIAPKSLKVIFKGSERATMIDSASAKSLELVRNLKDPMSQQNLFGVLNHTKTAGGARLLRSNILQPPNDKETIQQRQEVVKELTGKEDIFYNLQSAVSKFPDIGHVVSICVQIPKQESVRMAETKITCVIMLKHILQLVAVFKENLSYCENNLLKLYCQSLDNPNYEIMLKKINEIISSETHYTKGLLQQKMQKCMAVKEGVNGMLDVARRTHRELVQDLHTVIEQIGKEFDLPLRSAYNSLRGHHIQLPCSAVPASSSDHSSDGAVEMDRRHGLPSKFIKVSKFKNTLSFTTMELIRLNERLKHAMDEIFLMANIVVSDLLTKIRNHIGCLYELADSVSMVDMLLAFSHSATLYSYVLPEFTDTLAVKQGLHPILQTTGSDNFVPNDIYASEHSNFIIITGPNMGGKSTYLRQVALLQIMAQIGSFVPAIYASFRIACQIFSRIGSDDDMESNSSTFTLEMKETSYILQNITDSSLIIIDELGRGTSAEEGVGLCWAVAEKILATKAMTFFVTHFLQLTELSQSYPNVANYFFEVQRVFNTEAKCENRTFTHVLTRGVTPETHYGLQLAQMSSLPSSVIEDARRIATSVEKTRERYKRHDSEQLKEHACFNLATKLIQVAKNSRMDEDSLRSYLKMLRRNYVADLEKANKRKGGRSSTDSDVSFST